MPNQMIRSRSGGRSFELRITDPSLPKPVYRTFSNELEARRAGQSALAALGRGETPEWLCRPDKNPIPTVGAAIVAFISAKSVPANTQAVLETVRNQIGKVPIADVNYRWAESWIESLKLESRVTPGTIRKKVGAALRPVAASSKPVQPITVSTLPATIKCRYTGRADLTARGAPTS
jgi:hypothetical protein